MPTYEYACTSCDHTFEQVQSFADASLTSCPECGGALRKLYGAVGVVFKGSGFYRTDSRKAESSSTPITPSKSDGAGTSGKKEKSGTPSTASAPAAASTPLSTSAKPSTTSSPVS